MTYANFHNSDMPSAHYVAVTASDSTTYSPMPRSLYVGTGGTVAVERGDGTSVSFTNVPNGSILPIAVRRVLVTGTSGASGFVLLY